MITYRSKVGRPTRGGIDCWRNQAGIWTFRFRWQINDRRYQKVITRDANKQRGQKRAEAMAAKMRELWETESYGEALQTYRRWDDALEEFLRWARAHMEASSARRYRNALKNWQDAGLCRDLLVETQGLEFEEYKSLRLQRVSAATINYEIRTLKRFWNWCAQSPRRWVWHDPFEGIAPLREEKGADFAPRILSAEECAKIRAIAPDYVVAVFDLAIDTGLRMGELIWLDAQDVDLASDSLEVRSKPQHRVKDKERRTVPLSSRAWSILAARIDLRPKGAVFVGPRRRNRWLKLSRSLNLWIKKAAPDASLKTCRATFISYALRDTGGDLMTVMRWAGHANVETTKHYLSAIPRAQKQAIDQVRFP